MLLGGLVLVSARPADEEESAVRASHQETNSQASDVIEGTSSAASDVIEGTSGATSDVTTAKPRSENSGPK